MVVDFDFDDDEEKRPTIQDLTFDMTGKSDDELWAIVADACRSNSRNWRAYEKLHGRFTQLKNQEKVYSKTRRVKFEAELLSEAMNKAERWRKEHPRALLLSATEVFNPSGKSSITYHYKTVN